MQESAIPVEATMLGPLTAEFRTSGGLQILNLIGGVVFLLGGLVGMAAGPVVSWMEGEFGPMILSFCGLIAAALGAWTVYGFFRDRGWRVLLFPKGVAEVRGGKTTVLPWDDATHFWYAVTKNYRNGIYVGTTYNFTIQGENGQKLSFRNGLTDVSNKKVGVERLGEVMRDETMARLYPKYAAAYNAGQTITFGPLSISKQGISNGKETIAWEQVKGINLDRGVINIQKEGKWFTWKSATVGGTPNVFVFLSMVDQIAGLNKKK